MKKIFSVLIAVLLLISCCTTLASCGGKDATVSSEEWDSALQIGDVPYHLIIKLSTDGYTATMEQKYADGKLMMIESYAGGFAIDYMEKADGGHYFYNDDTQAETVEADRHYTKRFVSLEDTEGEDEFEDTVNGPKRMFTVFIGSYDSFTYDEVKKCYVAEELFSTLTDVSVTFTDGKMTALSYTESGETFSIEISYDNITVTLPEVNQ